MSEIIILGRAGEERAVMHNWWLCLRLHFGHCSVGLLVLEEQNEQQHLEGKPSFFLFVVGCGLCAMGALYTVMVRLQLLFNH